MSPTDDLKELQQKMTEYIDCPSRIAKALDSEVKIDLVPIS